MAKNLLSRILTGIVFITVILGGILLGEYSYALIISIIEILALLEFYRLIEKAYSLKLNKVFNTIGGILLFTASFLYCSGLAVTSAVFTPYILYILLLFISQLYLKRENPISALAYSLLGQAYLAVPFFLLNYIVFSYTTNTYHIAFILAIFVFIWINDSFAYLSGVTLGKHKMFERISPKKSWEGFAGGALFTLGTSIAFSYFFPELSLFAWLGFAAVVITFGTFGDLIESLIKRTLNIKDSGTVLPGHGGILDRFDSMIGAIPALFIYIQLINFFN